MRNELFNSSFEIELRITALLSEMSKEFISADRILAIDFYACYGRTFGVSDYNLHGDNSLMYAEISNRRKLINEAIKPLVYNGLVEVKVNKGYFYRITEIGMDYVNSLESDYAREYRLCVGRARDGAANKSDRMLLNEINRRSLENAR